MRKHRLLVLLCLLMIALILATASSCRFSGETGLPADLSQGTTDDPGSPSSGEAPPVGTLPSSIVDDLGSGFLADLVLQAAGLEAAGIEAGHYRFYVGKGKDVVVDMQVVRHAGDWVIKTAIQADSTGYKLLFSPSPDAAAINDFQITAGDLTLSLGTLCSEKALTDKLGDPIESTVKIRAHDDGSGKCLDKIMRYESLRLVLTQPADCDNADSWTISRIECANTDFSNPRGLCAGMTYRRAVQILGTGDFSLLPDRLPDPSTLTVLKNDSVQGGISRQIELLADGDRITTVVMSLLET